MPLGKGCSRTRRQPWKKSWGRSFPRMCGWWRWKRRLTPPTWCFPSPRLQMKASSSLTGSSRRWPEAGTHKPRGSLALSSRLVAEWNAPERGQMADHGALLRSAGSLEYGLSFMFLPPVLLTGPTRPGYLPLLGAYKSELFTQVRGETVCKIAGGFSSVCFCRQEAADRLPFVPSWTLSEARFGAHSAFPNSFGARL